MISVANPIYDTVFKYLVEDLRVARTLVSALKLSGMSLEEISALSTLSVDVLKSNL